MSDLVDALQPLPVRRGEPVLVGVVMGSDSDFETMRVAVDVLDKFGVGHEVAVVSAHRTPDRLVAYASSARDRGLLVIIAGAGGAAHLPGMIASMTTLPVLGVPVSSKALSGLDSLLSIVQMPAGVPTATFAIGTAGAHNAALCAVQILATSDAALAAKLVEHKAELRSRALEGHARISGFASESAPVGREGARS